jgi:hypothetical protein
MFFSFFLDVFRKIDFGPDPEGHGRLNVFQLHSNPSYYLATTNLRHLELQVYFFSFLLHMKKNLKIHSTKNIHSSLSGRRARK